MSRKIGSTNALYVTSLKEGRVVRVQEIKHLVKTHGVRVFPILPLASSRMGAHNRRWTDRDTGGRTRISVRSQNVIIKTARAHSSRSALEASTRTGTRQTVGVIFRELVLTAHRLCFLMEPAGIVQISPEQRPRELPGPPLWELRVSLGNPALAAERPPLVPDKGRCACFLLAK